MEPVNSVENVEALEVYPRQPKEYFHIITRKNNGRHSNTATNSHLAIKKSRKRGRKPKALQSDFEGQSNPQIPEGAEPKLSKRVPCLMVNEREKRKKSTRFTEFLEVIKGEKDFYIDQEDTYDVKPGKKGRGRKKKEQEKQTLNSCITEAPIHHIFSDGHLSVLAQSIDDISDTTCVIHVKEGDSQENSLFACIRDDTTLSESSLDESSKFINTIELKEELNFDLNPLSDLKKSDKPNIKIEEEFLAISDYENEMESLQIFESQNGIHLQVKREKTGEYIDENFKSEQNLIIEPEKDSTVVHKINSLSEPSRNFRCKLCSEMFLTFEDAKRHAKTFHSSAVFEATNKECNEPDYRCPECDRTFPTEKGRNKHHLLMHLKNKPVSCPDCLVCFNSFRSLERHLKTDHDRNPVNFCDICEEEFVLTASLEHHISISHPPKSKLTMDTQYARHIKRVIQCPICNKKVIGSKAFRWHHSKIHNGEPFTCKQCKYRTYSISMLKRHLATVHKALNLSLYVCSNCKAGYQIPQDLEDHYISAHNRELDYLCPFCGERFACVEMLRYHKGKHRAYTCQFCPMGFMKPETLEEHLSTVHKHDLSKEAETLLEKVSIEGTSNMIENEKTEEDASSTSGLLNTVNTKILEIKHDGSVEVKENLLPLTLGETQGPSRESPNRVYHLHHTKDGNLQELDLNNPLKGFRLKDLPKKINCPICNKLLTTKFLKTHMRSHEGSLPHKCPKCSKAYAQGTLLRKHMKSKHYEDFLKLGNKMPKKKKIQCEYCELVLDDIYLMEDPSLVPYRRQDI
ncbi:Zinc finger protein [Armadillidium nasatum]|uniref:Zinc finger protein n=1 Tax=Armadillidium nasatum TaxID=96803 RepID=A0A5N5SI24_9CRUS|nr:Zinc finger protein [Armadillidium nasatum]